MLSIAVVTCVFALKTASVNELFQKLIFSLPMKETSKLELKTWRTIPVHKTSCAGFEERSSENTDIVF
jgi:hypothetical protein